MFNSVNFSFINTSFNGYTRLFVVKRALFISVLHTMWCSSMNCLAQFHQYQLQTYNTWLRDVVKPVVIKSFIHFLICPSATVLLFAMKISLEMLSFYFHLLFLVDVNRVVVNMPFHVLTQDHNGRCYCLPSRLAASLVLYYFTSFVQL